MEEWGNDFVLSINQHLDTISWFTKYLHVILHKPFRPKPSPHTYASQPREVTLMLFLFPSEETNSQGHTT